MLKRRYRMYDQKIIPAMFLVLCLTSCDVFTNTFTEIPAVPANVRVYANSTSETIISWSTTVAASEYVVYRSLFTAGPFLEIGVTLNNSYHDRYLNENSEYFYKVAGRNKNGIGNQSGAVKTKTPKPDDISFWAADLTISGKYYRTWAELIETRAHCVVYQEITGYTSHNSQINKADIEKLADKFNDDMYGKITNVFGYPMNKQEHEKVVLLLLDIQDGYKGSTDPYVAGFFHSKDLYKGVYSNEANMIYIDTWPASLKNNPDQVYNTVVHEFQHLINTSKRMIKGQREMDLWIDEGLAESASYVYSVEFNDSRIEYYTRDPRKSIGRGNNFYVWYDDWDDILAEYASAYLFFQWLRIHSGKDTAIYTDIINSSFYDYQAVVEAAGKSVSGLGTNPSWENILTHWMAANLLTKPTGILGYKDKISELNVKPLSNVFVNRISLAPGEGVFTTLTSSFTPPSGSPYGPNIRYAEVVDSGSSSHVNRQTPFNSDGNSSYLLTYNSNTKTRVSSQNDYENGYVVPNAVYNSVSRTNGQQNTQSEEITSAIPEPADWDSASFFLGRFNERPAVPKRD